MSKSFLDEGYITATLEGLEFMLEVTKFTKELLAKYTEMGYSSESIYANLNHLTSFAYGQFRLQTIAQERRAAREEEKLIRQG